jgi:hypothetical protein
VPDTAPGRPGATQQTTAPRPGTIRQGDRDKALRPLPLETRRTAFEHALEAYAGDDFFEAHELLEPAWMGTADLQERALHQGLIKVAAAYVHAVRGNPAGITRNLQGARGHLAHSGAAARAWGVDVVALIADVDTRLADPATVANLPPPAIRRTPVP